MHFVIFVSSKPVPLLSSNLSNTLFIQVLAELPAPVINGTKLTVEDFQQELSCSINIKHRFVSLYN